MKIAQLTFWHSEDNYGQILQCYALQCYLKQLGHDVFLIRHSSAAEQKGIVVRILNFFLKNIWRPSYYTNKRKLKKYAELAQIAQADVLRHPRGFKDFKSKYISSTDILSFDKIQIAPPFADAYIAGSDQVWGGPSEYFHMRFAPKGTLRLSYAASGVPAKLSDKYVRYLKDCDVVTLREQSAVNTCKAAGIKDAMLVPDPTFLLSSDKYRNLYQSEPVEIPKKKYLFMYLLGNEMDFDIQSTFNWAQDNGLDVKYVASSGRADDFPKIYPTIPEWLALIDNAEYVVTNSFHGMAFCIIFNKKFKVIPLADKFVFMNTRLSTILGKFNLSERLYTGTMHSIGVPIDYSRVNAILNKESEEISECFVRWLSQSPKN